MAENQFLRWKNLQLGNFEELGVKEKESIRYYSLASADADSLMNRDDVSKLEIRLGCLSGLEEHAEL